MFKSCGNIHFIGGMLQGERAHDFYKEAAVPQGDWNNMLTRDKDNEIPCRRMRSGSYIKAMGDDDSEDSETSPKPSPKTAARRQSYLKATQQSLGEQSTTHRSLDRLDSVEILLPPKFPSWEEEYNQISENLNESSCINQLSEEQIILLDVDVTGQNCPVVTIVTLWSCRMLL
ncbi:disks large-associated protein 4-like [Candoia aspera]|uniref:disks large-associated protein 4-like n=1 Tax=Candoia aspera TaxID=51853 RepID=UPI002FD7D153